MPKLYNLGPQTLVPRRTYVSQQTVEGLHLRFVGAVRCLGFVQPKP